MAIKVESRRTVDDPVEETEQFATWSDAADHLLSTATPEYQEQVYVWWTGSAGATPLTIDNGPTVDTWTVEH